jgi:hypothetical protein
MMEDSDKDLENYERAIRLWEAIRNFCVDEATLADLEEIAKLLNIKLGE